MFKKTIISSAILALILSASPVWANRFDDEEQLPRHARQIRKGVYDLGVAVDSLTRASVSGRAYVHAERNGVDIASTATCYGYIAPNTKWRTNESFLVNPSDNRSSLAGGTILARYNAALGKWEDAADGVVDGGGPDIVGTASTTGSRLRADYGYPDGKNEVYFARLSRGTIAVTVVWYTFTGSIVEVDQVFNNRFAWSAEAGGVAGKMDLDNIATHENGHLFGLDDQYDSSCAAVTMYGYADYGEITKRDLDQPDITGIDNLY